MIDVEIATLLTCVAGSTSLWLLKPTFLPISPAYIIVIGLVIFWNKIWMTIADFAVQTPWLGRILIISILGYLVFQLNILWDYKQPEQETDVSTEQSDSRYIENALKPLVFPARTTHTRFFPKKHSFSYSYLLVGVPVRWHGGVDSFLSVDLPTQPSFRKPWYRRAWFSISPVDYLERGCENLGLHGKLQSYLKTQVGYDSLTTRNLLRTRLIE